MKLDNAYKIGYAKDVDKRFKTLQATHIDSEIISIRKGTTKTGIDLYYISSGVALSMDRIYEIIRENE